MAAAFVFTALVAGVARWVAARYNPANRPAGHATRWQPAPFLGGAAIALGTLVPVVAPVHSHNRTLWAIAGAAVAVAVLGLAHDVRGLSVRFRLATETLLAIAIVASGGRLHVAGPGWLDVALTVCWIVLLTNSMSLLDTVDGVLATVACATVLPLAVLLAVGGQPRLGGLMVCLSAACGGYLLHNMPPARISMGNTGSLFIGLIIAAGTTWLPAKPDRSSHMAVLLLLVFPAVVNSVLVAVSRASRGRSPWPIGADHLTHRLRRLGLSDSAVVAALLLVTAICGLSASFVSGGLLSGPLVLPGAGAAAVVLVGFLLMVPARPLAVASSTSLHDGPA